MTVCDLPVEGLRPCRVHPTTSSTRPASQKPTDTDGARRLGRGVHVKRNSLKVVGGSRYRRNRNRGWWSPAKRSSPDRRTAPSGP